MKIGILETGLVPEELREQFKGYPTMFETMLGKIDPTLVFQTWTVLHDGFPASTRDADAWIVTGSRHGVYENAPWMIRLQGFLRDIVADGVPIFGVCFGHQILATALGGKVIKSDKGWGVGVQEYAATASNANGSAMGDVPARFKLNAFHQDQVVELPEGATVLAGSDFCPYAVLQYSGAAASIQPHPEFQRPFEQALLESRADILPDDIHDAATRSLDQQIDSDPVARWILDFLKKNAAAQAA